MKRCESQRRVRDIAIQSRMTETWSLTERPLSQFLSQNRPVRSRPIAAAANFSLWRVCTVQVMDHALPRAHVMARHVPSV